jgi:hypothetical protein
VEKSATVSLDATTTVDLTLQLSTEEQVLVSGEAPPIDLTSTTGGTNYTSEVVTRLPAARNYADIVRSNPGVSTDRGAFETPEELDAERKRAEAEGRLYRYSVAGAAEDAGRSDRRRRPDPRARRVPRRCARRFRTRALRRSPALPLHRLCGRRGHAHHPRSARGRPPREYAQARRAVSSPRRGGTSVRPPRK